MIFVPMAMLYKLDMPAFCLALFVDIFLALTIVGVWYDVAYPYNNTYYPSNEYHEYDRWNRNNYQYKPTDHKQPVEYKPDKDLGRTSYEAFGYEYHEASDKNKAKIEFKKDA